MDTLKCETEAGVAKELAVFAIVYNLVRVVMLEASRRQEVPVSRISFVDALRWLSSAPPGSPLPRLVVNPDRAGRVEPRCKKRRAKKYPYMIRPRQVLKQKLLHSEIPASLHGIQVIPSSARLLANVGSGEDSRPRVQQLLNCAGILDVGD